MIYEIVWDRIRSWWVRRRLLRVIRQHQAYLSELQTRLRKLLAIKSTASVHRGYDS